MAPARQQQRRRRTPAKKVKGLRREGPAHPQKCKLPDHGGVPPMSEMQTHFASEAATISYLLEMGVLQVPICSPCGMQMRSTGGRLYQCVSCKTRASITGSTFFRGVKVPLNKILLLMYCFILEMNYINVRRITGLSRDTVTNKLMELRQLIGTTVRAEGDKYMVGGPGRYVQVDESKFGKVKRTKGKRGHPVPGGWVLGGTELATDQWGHNDYFAVCVKDRKATTMLPILR